MASPPGASTIAAAPSMPTRARRFPGPCRRCEPQRHVQRRLQLGHHPPSILGLLRRANGGAGEVRVGSFSWTMPWARRWHLTGVCRYQFGEQLTAPNRYPCSGSRPRAGRGSGVIDPHHLAVVFWGPARPRGASACPPWPPTNGTWAPTAPGRRMPTPKGYSNRCSHSGIATDILLSITAESPPTTVRRNSPRSGRAWNQALRACSGSDGPGRS
jgi:hypothetical protein